MFQDVLSVERRRLLKEKIVKVSEEKTGKEGIIAVKI